MPLQSSGEIKLSQVATEFGSDGSTQLTDYNRGGAQVPASPSTTGISGTDAGLKLSQFYAKSSVFFSSWNIAGDLNFRVQGPSSSWGTIQKEVTANLTKANDTGGDISFNLLVEVGGAYEDTQGDVVVPNGQSSGSLTYALIVDGNSNAGIVPVKLQGSYGESPSINLNYYECRYEFDFEYQTAALEYQYTGFFNYRQRQFKGYLWTGSFKAAKRDCNTFACDEYVQVTTTTWTASTTNNSFGTLEFSSTQTESQVFAAFGASAYYNDADCRSSTPNGDCAPLAGVYRARSVDNGRTANYRTEQQCTTRTRQVAIAGRQHPNFGTTCFEATSAVLNYCGANPGCSYCVAGYTTESYQDCQNVQVFDGYTYEYELFYNVATSSETTEDTDECQTFSTTDCETFGSWANLNTQTLYTNAGYSASTPTKLYMTEEDSIIGEGHSAFNTSACKSSSPSDAINCAAGLQTLGQDPNYPESQIGVYDVGASQGAEVFTDWSGTLSVSISQSSNYYVSDDDYLSNHQDGAYAAFNTTNCKNSSFNTNCEGNSYPTDVADALQQEFWNVQANEVLSTERQSSTTQTITATSGDGGDGGSTRYITHVEGSPILQTIIATSNYVEGSVTLTSATAPSPNTNNSNCPTTGELT